MNLKFIKTIFFADDDLTTDGEQIPMLEMNNINNNTNRYSAKNTNNLSSSASSSAVPLFVDIPSNNSSVPIFVDIPPHYQTTGDDEEITDSDEGDGCPDNGTRGYVSAEMFGDYIRKDDDVLTEDEDDGMTIENHDVYRVPLSPDRHLDLEYKKIHLAMERQDDEENDDDFTRKNNDFTRNTKNNNINSEKNVIDDEDGGLSELMDQSSSRIANLPPPPQELLSDHHSNNSNTIVAMSPSFKESLPRHPPPPMDFSGENDNKFCTSIATDANSTPINATKSSQHQDQKPLNIVESVKLANTRPCLKKNRNNESLHQTSNNNKSNFTTTTTEKKKSVRYPSTIEVASEYYSKKPIKRSQSVCSGESSPISNKRLVSLMNSQGRDFVYASHQMDMLTINNRSQSIDLHSTNKNHNRDCSKNSRRCKQIRNESPLFQTASALSDGGGMDQITPTKMPHPMSNRTQRKGKIHVIGTTTTTAATANSKNNNIDKNISTSKNHHQCRLPQPQRNDSINRAACYTTYHDEMPVQALSLETVGGHSPHSHDSAVTHQQSEHEQPISIEESGYQSRESDSFASSNRSTDDDCHVFSPSSTQLQGILKTSKNHNHHHHHHYQKYSKQTPPRGGRSGRNSKRPEYSLSSAGGSGISVPLTLNNNNNNNYSNNNNNSKVLNKVARRIRYENTRAKQQTDGLRPSESSLEDTSSRDSIQLPRNRVKALRRREESTVVGPSHANIFGAGVGRNPARLTSPAVYYSDPDSTSKKVKIMMKKYDESIFTE